MEEQDDDDEASGVIKFKLTPQLAAFLDALKATGIIANTRTSVVRVLVNEGIQAKIRDGLLKPPSSG